MQHKCAQHKWDQFFFFMIRDYKTNVLDSRGERKREDEKKPDETKNRRFFSHYLVSVKNRNSPVTFILHFLIIYTYIHGFFSLIICHCPLCLYQQFTKERKLQSNAYTLLETCA